MSAPGMRAARPRPAGRTMRAAAAGAQLSGREVHELLYGAGDDAQMAQMCKTAEALMLMAQAEGSVSARRNESGSRLTQRPRGRAAAARAGAQLPGPRVHGALRGAGAQRTQWCAHPPFAPPVSLTLQRWQGC